VPKGERVIVLGVVGLKGVMESCQLITGHEKFFGVANMPLGKKKANDACTRKVKARYSVWPSAYASGALVRCRKVGAKNWGNKGNK
jgi:hypothetical protein